MLLFPQKDKAQLTAAGCKHTAHYPGIEHSLIYRTYPSLCGCMLWDSVQMSFSCNFETYIPADVHVDGENSEEEKKK